MVCVGVRHVCCHGAGKKSLRDGAVNPFLAFFSRIGHHRTGTKIAVEAGSFRGNHRGLLVVLDERGFSCYRTLNTTLVVV